jgi:hypothetical protein
MALDTEYVQIMRQAAALADAPLLDGAEALAARPGVYTDFCHFDAAGHRLIAELLASHLAGRVLLDDAIDSPSHRDAQP